MKNEILGVYGPYTVLDVSTNTFKAQTIIDTHNYDKIKEFKLRARATSGGQLKVEFSAGGRSVLLSRFIMDAPADMEVDHRDGNTLVNIESNLRVCTHEENSQNKHKNSIKGVHKSGGKWKAELRYKGEFVYLGLYETKEEAAQAYNKAAIMFFGEFACLNTVTCEV